MSDFDLFTRCLVALLAGAIVGAERQSGQKLAGVKTHALVSLGACLFTLVGMLLSSNMETVRIVAQIASGVGFLGAGAILRDGTTVKGLTTAATVWCVAAIGCIAGAGLHKLVFMGVITVFLGTILLRQIATYLFPTEDANNDDQI